MFQLIEAITEGAVLAATIFDWHRSSHSWNGDCVELSHTNRHLYIRDSKHPGQILDIRGKSRAELIDYVRQIAELG